MAPAPIATQKQPPMNAVAIVTIRFRRCRTHQSLMAIETSLPGRIKSCKSGGASLTPRHIMSYGGNAASLAAQRDPAGQATCLLHTFCWFDTPQVLKLNSFSPSPSQKTSSPVLPENSFR